MCRYRKIDEIVVLLTKDPRVLKRPIEYPDVKKEKKINAIPEEQRFRWVELENNNEPPN